MHESNILASILRYDTKQTSYKIALLRALNDVILSFPGLSSSRMPVAVPFREVARFWIAYYWPFCHSDTEHEVLQGRRSVRYGEPQPRNDISFRKSLTKLMEQWELLQGERSRPSDGFFLIQDMHLPRKRHTYARLVPYYDEAIRDIMEAVCNPIKYAGQGNWTVFGRPTKYSQLQNIACIPGTRPKDECVVVSPKIWSLFTRMSLWVEALSIHEWCLFTERITQHNESHADRGDVYRLLTNRPDNRRPLTWERNSIDVLLEGYEFICRWTGTQIRQGSAYDLDHLIPVTVYQANEMWNLVPADPYFNERVKRDRLPSMGVLRRARPHLASTYHSYASSVQLSSTIREDSGLRYTKISSSQPIDQFVVSLTGAVVAFIDQVATSRTLLSGQFHSYWPYRDPIRASPFHSYWHAISKLLALVYSDYKFSETHCVQSLVLASSNCTAIAANTLVWQYGTVIPSRATNALRLQRSYHVHAWLTVT